MKNSDEVIENIYVQQQDFFASGKTLPIAFRITALRKLEQSLMDHEQDILEALEEDLGKPGMEAYLSEYYFLLSEIRLICKKLKGWLKPERVASPVFIMPARSKIVRRPYGQQLIIAPWNYPVQLAISPLVAAVAAGNTVVLKPSEMASRCALLLEEIIKKSFSTEHVAVVNGDAGRASHLLGLRWDFIFYTGSERVGKIVSEAAAQYLTPSILELGGKCPCIVDKCADIEKTIERVLTGKFFNGGQTCFAPDYLVVHESIRSEFVDALTRALNDYPWEESLARMINKDAYERVRGLVPDEPGNVFIKGADREEGLHLAPRIVSNVNWEDRIMQEEIFGPVLPVLTFADHRDLMKRINNLPTPLTIYFFSKNKLNQRAWLEGARAGAFCFNDTMKQGINLNLPFGGVGQSGYGRYRGKHGVISMSYACSVVKRYFIKDIFAMLPPYGDRLKWMRKFLK